MNRTIINKPVNNIGKDGLAPKLTPNNMIQIIRSIKGHNKNK